jgi:hypothetical protein
MLSQLDIRADVLLAPEALDRHIWHTINRARKELLEKNGYYAITNIRDKGYQLVRCETLHESSQTFRTPLKLCKNGKKIHNVR